MHQRAVHQLRLSQIPDAYADYTYDLGAHQFKSHEAAVRTMCLQKFEQVFRRHGAIELHAPLLFPRVGLLAAVLHLHEPEVVA